MLGSMVLGKVLEEGLDEVLPGRKARNGGDSPWAPAALPSN